MSQQQTPGTSRVLFMDVAYSRPGEEEKSADGSFENRLLLEPRNYKTLLVKKQSVIKRIAFHTLTFLLAVAITAFLGFLVRPFPAKAPHMKTLHCGTTSAEARALNCTYDVLSNIWVPTPCLDKENLDDFKRLAQWQAYETRDATHMLTEDEMGNVVGPNTYFTPIREHMVHCALMWRRLHKGYQEDQKYLDHHVRAYAHTVHCSQLMMDFLEKPRSVMDKIVSQTIPGFSTCKVNV